MFLKKNIVALLRSSECAEQKQRVAAKLLWGRACAKVGGDNFHFSKCFRPFIQSVKSTLFYLFTLRVATPIKHRLIEGDPRESLED